jgi:HK97 family phage major capsid protein
MNPEEIQKLVDATVEAVDAKIKTELPAVKAEEVPAVETVTKADAEKMANDAVKAAIDQAAKAFEARLVESRRPVYTPPTIVKKAGPQTPFVWAAKASLMTGENIVFDLASASEEGIEFDGTSAAKAAFKAMATTASGAVGEHFIPLLQANRVIENLYQQAIVKQLPGVTNYPMNSLIEYIPTIGAFSAGWSAENATATSAGDATTGRKTLTAKNLTALATVSNQLLQDSTPAIEEYIRRGLAQAMGEAYDTGALYGTNANNQPLGVTSTSNVTSTAISTDNFFEGVISALGRMDANKTPKGNRIVLCRPEVVAKAARTRSSTGGDFFTAQAPMAPLAGQNGLDAVVSARLGVPVFTTTVIPSASSTSSILVFYAPDFILGDRQEMEIAASNVAGNAFAYNQTLIRAITRVDFLLARATSLEIVTGFAH